MCLIYRQHEGFPRGFVLDLRALLGVCVWLVDSASFVMDLRLSDGPSAAQPLYSSLLSSFVADAAPHEQ